MAELFCHKRNLVYTILQNCTVSCFANAHVSLTDQVLKFTTYLPFHFYSTITMNDFRVLCSCFGFMCCIGPALSHLDLLQPLTFGAHWRSSKFIIPSWCMDLHHLSYMPTCLLHVFWCIFFFFLCARFQFFPIRNRSQWTRDWCVWYLGVLFPSIWQFTENQKKKRQRGRKKRKRREKQAVYE